MPDKLPPQDLLYLAETDILAEIARLLGNGSIDSADWKFQRLKDLGRLSRFAEETILRYRKSILDGTDDTLEKIMLDELAKSDALLSTLPTPLVPPAGASVAMRSMLEIWQRTAKGSMNLAMAKLLDNAGPLYVDSINKAVLNSLTGAMTRREALNRAIGEWIDSGVPSIVDKAGREWSTEAYGNMVIRTNSTRVATETQLQRAEEYGIDLIEVSSHVGARPGCAPYQGMIFSRSGTSTKYPALSETSYGEASGLAGVNCGHVFYPFIEGVSTKTYSPYPESRNDAAYEKSQVQRKIERNIRSAKRGVIVAEANGDPALIAKSKERVKNQQAAMRSFIEETGRTRRRDREQIVT